MEKVVQLAKLIDEYLEFSDLITRAQAKKGVYPAEVITSLIKDYQKKMEPKEAAIHPLIQDVVAIHQQLTEEYENLNANVGDTPEDEEMALLRSIGAAPEDAAPQEDVEPNAEVQELYERLGEVERVLMRWSTGSGMTVPLEMRFKPL